MGAGFFVDDLLDNVLARGFIFLIFKNPSGPQNAALYG